MKRYESDFVKAMARTKELGMSPTKLQRNPKYALSKAMHDFIDERIKNLGLILGLGKQVLRKNCMFVHADIVRQLRESFKVKPIFTIGYVLIDGIEYCKFDKSFIENELKTGPSNSDLAVHAWITFPSKPYFEILDLTLTSTLEIGVEPGAPVRMSGWFQPEGIEYHPVLTGHDFIDRTTFNFQTENI
jgi:hypothetical protein